VSTGLYGPPGLCRVSPPRPFRTTHRRRTLLVRPSIRWRWRRLESREERENTDRFRLRVTGMDSCAARLRACPEVQRVRLSRGEGTAPLVAASPAQRAVAQLTPAAARVIRLRAQSLFSSASAPPLVPGPLEGHRPPVVRRSVGGAEISVVVHTRATAWTPHPASLSGDNRRLPRL